MTMTYICEAAGGPPIRKMTGLRVFSMGEYRGIGQIAIPSTYDSGSFKWGGSLEDAEPLSIVLMEDCLRIAEVSSGSGGPMRPEDTSGSPVERLHKKFAERFICSADPGTDLSLDWLEVLTWMDDQIHGEPGTLAQVFRRIRDFEGLLRAAFDDGGQLRKHRVSGEIWETWNIEAFTELCIVNGQLSGDRLRRFIDHFLDLKFKLYMLAEVDVPTYASAKELWRLDRDHPSATPHGFATQLSEEVMLIVKSRAIWESVMNLVYWYVTGKEIPGINAVDEDGVSYKSKQKKFFPWAAKEPLWASLTTFEPLVSKLDQLRTSEVHKYSRVRSNFTRMTLEPIDQCV